MVQNFELNALNKYQVVELFVSKAISEAVSLSSRSVIRKALVEYKNNNIDWDTLYSITEDKYKDGVNAIENFQYAGRLVNDKILVEIGDSKVLNDIDLTNTKSILVKYNTDNNIIAIKNPIFDGENLVGYDILCFDMTPILEKIKSKDVKIWIETDVLEGQTIEKDGMITVGKACNAFNATLYTQISEDILFNSINNTKKHIFIFFSIVLLGTFLLLYAIVVKYAKDIVKQIEDSKNAAINREKENLQLINEMNKGFVFFEIIDDIYNT